MTHILSPLANPRRYSDEIQIHCGNTLRQISHNAQQVLNSEDLGESPILITITGSDARKENNTKLPNSGLEFQVYTRSHTPDLIASISQRVSKVLPGAGDVEVRNLGCDTLSFYQNCPAKVFPTRILDSHIVHDTSAIYADCLKKIVTETREAEHRVCDHFQKRWRTHKSVMIKGVDHIHGQDYVSYNLDEGFVYFNPQSSIHGFKNGPLRYMQYTLVLALLRYFRDTLDQPEFLFNLTANIIERLDFIKEHKLTKKNALEIAELQNVYAEFLFLYHTMQYEYHTMGTTVFEIADSSDRKLLQEMLTLLQDACKVQDFFPVKK